MHVAELAAFLILLAALFGSAEVLRRRGIPADSTRRYTHVAGASVSALLPAFLGLAETVALGVVIAAALAWTRSRGLLRSVHDVERPTLGAVLFPLGLALAAIVGWAQPAAYALGALTLALADPAAALVGGRVKSPRWAVWRGTKSLAGSLAFAAVVVAMGLVMTAWVPLGFGAILVAAFFLAVVEGSLGFGFDNLVVAPLAALRWRAALSF
jgi:dolichol kinase